MSIACPSEKEAKNVKTVSGTSQIPKNLHMGLYNQGTQIKNSLSQFSNCGFFLFLF